MRVVAALFLTTVLAAACGDDGTGTAPDRESRYDDSTDPTTTAAAADQGDDGSDPEDVLPWPAPLGGPHQTWTVEIVDRLPHDAGAFTQGLEYDTEGLWESTGRYGESTLRLTDDATGAVLEEYPIADDHFGEGLTSVDGRLLQLTWRAGVAYAWADDRSTADLITYEGEGWGICHDGTDLWMTDGTDVLTRRSADLSVLERIAVTREGRAVTALNELECVGDHVVANVWQTDEIVVIDPATGSVAATIDAGVLRAEIQPTEAGAVLNGVADRGDGTVLLAGKLWPTHFVVELVVTDGG